MHIKNLIKNVAEFFHNNKIILSLFAASAGLNHVADAVVVAAAALDYDDDVKEKPSDLSDIYLRSDLLFHICNM